VLLFKSALLSAIVFLPAFAQPEKAIAAIRFTALNAALRWLGQLSRPTGNTVVF